MTKTLGFLLAVLVVVSAIKVSVEEVERHADPGLLPAPRRPIDLVIRFVTPAVPPEALDVVGVEMAVNSGLVRRLLPDCSENRPGYCIER